MCGKNRRSIFIPCLALALLWLWGGLCYAQSPLPSIRFLGAAQMIGGSCYLIDTGKTRLLVDFGLFYGPEQKERNSAVAFDPAAIDFVLLTHSHADHAGRIPLLYRKGFKGRTVGTDATKKLSAVMLEMNVSVAENQGTVLYDADDMKQVMHHFMVIPYDKTVQLNDEISVRFSNAGHILGSSIIEILIKNSAGTISVVAAGDLGNSHLPLLKAPDILHDGDYILVDATAAMIARNDADFDNFGTDIQKTLKMGGSVLIPAFVLDRTQRLLYIIGKLKQKGTIPMDTPVYVDSPTARKITKIYRNHNRDFRSETQGPASSRTDLLSFPHLYEISSRNALKMHEQGRPAIYITSSAMLDHGNSPRHLEKMIENPKDLLAIVAWQAPGTPGWKLQKGAKKISLPVAFDRRGSIGVNYVEKSVKMRIRTYDMFSYHADGCQILTWLSNFSKVKEVFVVHGEKENTVHFATMISKRLGFRASAPEPGDRFYLSGKARDYELKKTPALCFGIEASGTPQTGRLNSSQGVW